jgi:tetratricopeptide (TPR) repeat protein
MFTKRAFKEELVADFQLGLKESGLKSVKKEDSQPLISEITAPAMTEKIMSETGEMYEFTVISIKIIIDPSDHCPFDITGKASRMLEQQSSELGLLFSAGGHSTFFFIMKGVDMPAASDAARMLKKTVFETTGRNSGAGIARFPFMDFSRGSIFENSVKACFHSMFYCDDSPAEFDAVSLNISGDVFYQADDIQNAVKEYRKGLEIDPSNTNLINSLGVCLAHEKKYEAALAEFEKAASINPCEYLALYNAGVACVLSGKTEMAREFFIKAAEADDSDIKIVFHAGKAAIEKEDFQSAARFLEKAASLDPLRSQPYRYLGIAYTRTGNNDMAIDAFKKAVKINPEDGESFSALGELFAETGENPDIALVFARQGIALSPENGLMYFRLGRILLKIKDNAGALEAFEKARDLGYDSSENIELISKIMTDQVIEKAS